MKLNLAAVITILTAAPAAFSQATPAFSNCGTYGAYVMLYKNTDTFEQLGKLRCAEKVEILGKWFDYLQVRTTDGKTGWVRAADVTGGPASAPTGTPFGMTSSAAQPQHDIVVPLTNKNIISMQSMRLGADVILAKIKSSPTNFDTTPSGLQKLKFAGVPDKIILAMVQAQTPDQPTVGTAGSPAPSSAALNAPKAADVLQVKVPDGTSVDLVTLTTLSSDDVREGMTIHLKVLNDVVIDGVTVLRKDSDARARVYVINQPTFTNKVGDVEWAMQDVAAVNGDLIPVTFGALEAPAATASDIAAVDTGTSWQFRKKQPSNMPAGHRLRATTHGDITLKIPAALATQSPAPVDSAKTSSSNVQVSPEATLSTASSDSHNQKRRFSPM
jgi:uncharacterized protein YgiM (DUF1202 family)